MKVLLRAPAGDCQSRDFGPAASGQFSKNAAIFLVFYCRGGSTSWSYDVDAQDVQNAFSETDVKTWRFSPKSAANGDAWMEEPGIRSVSTSKTNCFTRTTLKCPFTTIFDIELKENTLDYSIYFTYGS